MVKIKCACGTSEKSFKKDIGPFYVDECCLKNGYDDLGRPTNQKPPTVPPPAAATSDTTTDKVSEEQLAALPVKDLRAMAEEKGITGIKKATGKSIIKKLLGK